MVARKISNRGLPLQLILTQIIIIMLVCLEELGIMSETISGILIILISCLNILSLTECKLLFTPLLFPNVYMLLFGLYELKLRIGMTLMAFEGKFVIALCMLIWTLLCVKSPYVFLKVKPYSKYRINPTKLRNWISVFAFVSIIMMIYEWYKAGAIPAFRSDAEVFRMSVSQNGMIHTLAIMIKIVALLIEVYWISRINTNQPGYRWFIILYFISLFMMWGTANRGELLFIPVLGIIIYWTKYQPSKMQLFLAFVAGLFVLAVYPAIRGYGMYGMSYFTQYNAVSKYPQLGWMMPLYGTLTYNFEILNRLFETFPNSVAWGMGQYTIFCRIPFFNFGEELWVVQNRVWNNGFYGALTSTYLGSWYSDFGYIGCFLGTNLICIANLVFYKKLINRNSFGSLTLYAYLFYMTMVGCYSDAFSFVFILYAMLIWFVMNQCEFEEAQDIL